MEKSMDRVEYQSIMLAALLHDIGKFLHRTPEAKGSHEEHSASFVKENMDILARDPAWIYPELVKKLVRFHHGKISMAGNDERLRALIRLVRIADSYSCGERATDFPLRRHSSLTLNMKMDIEDIDTAKLPRHDSPASRPLEVALNSIFAQVDLGEIPPSKSPEYGKKVGFCHNITEMSSLRESFPDESKVKLDENDIGKLIPDFKDEWEKITASNSFYSFYCNLLSTLEQFTWCIPSDTWREIADVSLYDHMKSSSAIAACLYRFHTDPEFDDLLKRGSITNDSKPRFLLVGGDLSGIQNYIFQIASIGEGGVAKRLRARSFYLSVLVEVIIHKILRELDLPVSCNLVSAGGRFILLVPNTGTIKEELQRLSKEISGWFLEEFSGELALNLIWDVKLCGEDLGIGEFSVPFTMLQSKIEDKKLKRLEEVLVCHTGWREEIFKRQGKYERYREKVGDCHSCRKFPEKYPDPDEEEEIIFCDKCYQDKILGRALIDAKYIAIGDRNAPQINWEKDPDEKKKLEDVTMYFFKEKGDNGYYVTPLKRIPSEAPDFGKDFFLVQRIAEREQEPERINVGIVNRFLANHIPFFQDIKEIEDLCRRCKEAEKKERCEHKKWLEKLTKEEKIDKQIYTFSCIAAYSTKKPDSGVSVGGYEEYKGDQLLGILKADVDWLGAVFSEGLGERVTISRYLTLSRMLDLFFSGWMWRSLKEGKGEKGEDFSKIYTVYSGGDDLLLVGPWKEIIIFSKHLYDSFRAFTCENNNITLSAGIAIVKPKYPIARAAEYADELMERSKNLGRNRLTLFNTTIKWEIFDKLKEFAVNFLDKEYNQKDPLISLSFIYRLLKYHNMFLEGKEKGMIEGLRYRSLLAYDIGRNILKGKGKGERKSGMSGEEIRNQILSMFDESQGPEKSPIYFLKIPIFWALLKNRRKIVSTQAVLF